jgi:hypothetical protein
MGPFALRGVLASLLLISPVLAHGDHSHVPEGSASSEDPIVCHALAQDNLGSTQN